MLTLGPSFWPGLHSKAEQRCDADTFILDTGTVENDKHHWAYELRFGKADALGMLMRKGATSSSSTEMIGATNESKELHARRLDCAKAHKDTLGEFYHIFPTFSHGSFEQAMASILRIANAADIYDFEQVFKSHIQRHLLIYREEILGVCAK